MPFGKTQEDTGVVISVVRRAR